MLSEAKAQTKAMITERQETRCQTNLRTPLTTIKNDSNVFLPDESLAEREQEVVNGYREHLIFIYLLLTRCANTFKKKNNDCCESKMSIKKPARNSLTCKDKIQPDKRADK